MNLGPANSNAPKQIFLPPPSNDLLRIFATLINDSTYTIIMLEIKVPSPGESITQVQIASWLVEDGQLVEKDQEIVEIDSDKATFPVSAPVYGKLKITVEEGETVDVDSVIATIDGGRDISCEVGLDGIEQRNQLMADFIAGIFE